MEHGLTEVETEAIGAHQKTPAAVCHGSSPAPQSPAADLYAEKVTQTWYRDAL